MLFYSSKKIRWTNIFTIKIIIFANFVQKIEFGLLHIQRMDVELTEFHLCKLSLYPVLGKSYFKSTKVLLNEYFYYG